MYYQETPDANICERMEILLQVCKIFWLKSCVRFTFSSRSSLTVMDLSFLGLTDCWFGTAPAQPLVCLYYCQLGWWRLVSTIYLCFPTCAQVWPFRRCWCMNEMRSDDALEGWNVETDLLEVKESKMRTWSPKVWQRLSCLLMQQISSTRQCQGTQSVNRLYNTGNSWCNAQVNFYTWNQGQCRWPNVAVWKGCHRKWDLAISWKVRSMLKVVLNWILQFVQH